MKYIKIKLYFVRHSFTIILKRIENFVTIITMPILHERGAENGSTGFPIRNALIMYS